MREGWLKPVNKTLKKQRKLLLFKNKTNKTFVNIETAAVWLVLIRSHKLPPLSAYLYQYMYSP